MNVPAACRRLELSVSREGVAFSWPVLITTFDYRVILDWLCQLLDDWLRDRRPDVTDDYGREPLLATQYERPSRTTIPKYAYRWSRPCAYGEECPHGRIRRIVKRQSRDGLRSDRPRSVRTRSVVEVSRTI
jgi:hypothetical protein